MAVPLLFPVVAASAELSATTLEESYQAEIRPIIEHYCYDCHAGDSPEADLNLAAFATWTDVRKDPHAWQKVSEMLGGRLMPPEEADQPTDAERARLQQWVHGFLTLEAQARAGDPGRVVLRRLSNAEYTYTPGPFPFPCWVDCVLF